MHSRLKLSFIYTVVVIFKHKMETLRHGRCRHTSNKHFLKKFNEPNHVSLCLR